MREESKDREEQGEGELRHIYSPSISHHNLILRHRARCFIDVIDPMKLYLRVFSHVERSYVETMAISKLMSHYTNWTSVPFAKKLNA